jgi:RNA polymerase sigma-70 factor (ECF subfamily)
LGDNNLHTERELFHQIAAGDQEAFSVIFRSYSNPLYWNALKLLKSEFWAEEIVQVVFEQLWANRGGLSKVELPSAYLYRMLTNKALDRIRRQAREVKMQYWLERQAEGSPEGKHAAVDWDELHALLENAVEGLPPQRREVYKLKYQDRLSYDEIAAQLSVSKNTVRNHMTKALEDIRAYLLKHAGFIGLLLWLAMLAVDASPVYRHY